MPELKGEETDGLMTVAGVAPTTVGPPIASASDGVARLGVPARPIDGKTAIGTAGGAAGSAPSWKKMPAGARGLMAGLDDAAIAKRSAEAEAAELPENASAALDSLRDRQESAEPGNQARRASCGTGISLLPGFGPLA